MTELPPSARDDYIYTNDQRLVAVLRRMGLEAKSQTPPPDVWFGYHETILDDFKAATAMLDMLKRDYADTQVVTLCCHANMIELQSLGWFCQECCKDWSHLMPKEKKEKTRARGGHNG